MRNRPWPIVILAITQLLTPFVSIALSAWRLKTPFGLCFYLFVKNGTFTQLFELFGLSAIACVSIYAIKRWSYPVFLAICAWGMISNYLVWAKNPHVYSLTMLIVVNLVNLAVVSYFLLPKVRIPYFNPKIRWWESKPRYRVSLDADIMSDAAGEACPRCQKGSICDISEGGIFLASAEALKLGESVFISFTIHHRKVSVHGKVVHQGRPGVRGYGVQFTELNRDERRSLREAVRGLELLGYERCNPQVDFLEDFMAWTVTLLKTGEGLVPQIPEKGAASVTRLAVRNSDRKVEPNESASDSDPAKAA